MFSKEFIEDYEQYGKDSKMCKHAFEQLKKSIEMEKSKKNAIDYEKQRKELKATIEREKAEIYAIALLIESEHETLSVETVAELSKLSDKIREDLEAHKQKLAKLMETKKVNRIDEPLLGELISFFL